MNSNCAVLVILQLVLLYSCGAQRNANQPGVVGATVDLNAYQTVAREQVALLTEDRPFNPAVTASSAATFRNEIIEMICLPYFNWKAGAEYTCGQPIDDLLIIEEIPYFQTVIGLKEGVPVATMSIISAYLENETGGADHFGPYGYNLAPDYSKNDDRLAVGFLRANPGALVFRVRGFPGIWVTTERGIKQIKSATRLIDSSRVLCDFGADYINHLIQENMATGFPYTSCTTCRGAK